MRTFAVILAAGKGQRFGADKTQIMLRGKPLWSYSYRTYLENPQIGGVGLVCSHENIAAVRDMATEAVFVIEGGTNRQGSSFLGVQAVPEEFEAVLVHDAARPFVSPSVIYRTIEGVMRSDAAVPGIPVTDTIKQRGEELRTLDRSKLVAVQTPQGAKRELLLKAHAAAKAEMTDEMALIEALGVRPEIVEGETSNFKITMPEDVVRATAMLGPAEVRTGFGYDIHTFSTDPSRTLMLGGVAFEGAQALDGHSDADVLLHAVVDALLGAAALGDIGEHFPNTDPRWKDQPSVMFLKHAKMLLAQRSWRILNIDASVVAEFPKVMKRALDIRQTIAEALDLDMDRVSVKATTNERMGAIGRGEGIAAFATATITQI